MRAHEVFAGQHRMHLVPNDRLAEIQTMLLEERWVVAAVGVPTPDVETATWIEHPSDVSKPRIEQSIELFVASQSRWPRDDPSLGASCALEGAWVCPVS
jgi:hypothetical protein